MEFLVLGHHFKIRGVMLRWQPMNHPTRLKTLKALSFSVPDALRESAVVYLILMVIFPTVENAE
jgi:hypothetical protein